MFLVPMNQFDPIFAQFQLGALPEPGYEVDFLGARVSHDVEPAGFSLDMRSPVPCEAYFEYADILKAVAGAGDSFAMLELGAGFGRWSAIAARAAAQKGKRAWFGLVEAEPRLLYLLHRHLADNNVREYRVWPFALAAEPGLAPFAVVPPPVHRADGWLGQNIIRNEMAGARSVDSYFGHELWEMSDGWGVIHVDQQPLSRVLAQCDRVIDLADLDLQGVEAEVVAEAIQDLNQRVRRLHIGTHGHEIEAQLRDTLSAAGWQLLQDYPCHGVSETPVGPVSFCDGVQSWVNPKLA